MRRLATVLCALAMTWVGVTTTATAANAAATVTNCNSSSGPGTLVSSNYVRVAGNGAAVGAAQLCKSGAYYWGYVVFYAPVQPNNWGQVRLDRYQGGTQVAAYTCDSAGGNGHVLPGQTQCWTPKINGGTSDKFQALGYSCFGSTYPSCPNTNLDAWGRTALTR
ncbi:hypothetical protein [Streptomyces sp. G-G2]|uniref:hypothetical protein n=1 Tax=Streptomyces sp. G-G2 TaxID=3046201 RepID=UPI0024BB6278|nr:hypothetical protein [Streptomyces sp. G-G2]MDJ0386375.1 hypothetical protein [Streptomyces sp. G-G2]